MTDLIAFIVGLLFVAFQIAVMLAIMNIARQTTRTNDLLDLLANQATLAIVELRTIRAAVHGEPPQPETPRPQPSYRLRPDGTWVDALGNIRQPKLK